MSAAQVVPTRTSYYKKPHGVILAAAAATTSRTHPQTRDRAMRAKVARHLAACRHPTRAGNVTCNIWRNLPQGAMQGRQCKQTSMRLWPHLRSSRCTAGLVAWIHAHTVQVAGPALKGRTSALQGQWHGTGRRHAQSSGALRHGGGLSLTTAPKGACRILTTTTTTTAAAAYEGMQRLEDANRHQDHRHMYGGGIKPCTHQLCL